MMQLSGIRKTLRKMLLEKENGDYKYGCVMAEVKITKEEWDKIQSHIEDDELYDSGNNFGREDNPHVTILYGLHTSVKDSEVEAIVDDFEPFSVELSKVDIFDTNPDFDVVKFSITDKNLSSYNEAMKELPYTNDYPDYKAHLTIAYVKKGKGEEIMGRYKDMEPISFEVESIQYSKADKSKKHYKLNSNE